MNKTIDQNKLKAKHVLEIYQSAPTYPQREDILYEIVKVLQDSSRLDISVRPEDIYKAVKTRYQEETLQQSMEYLTEHGFFSSEKKGKYTYFLLLTHPWVSETLSISGI
jgi:hypothetical protein